MALGRIMILHSGGIDSTTCLAIALNEHSALHEVGQSIYGRFESVSVDYGQRHKKEIQAAREVADAYGIEHTTLDIYGMPQSMLTDASIEVPNKSYGEISGISPTYVPFRNGQLLSKIAGHAQAWSQANNGDEVLIYFGAHAEDAAGWAYPDCTPEFIGAMANAIFIGSYQKVRLVAPLTYMNKKQIVEKGYFLGAPFYKTWSCYKGGDNHCGICPTCRARRSGFIEAGFYDPTFYEQDPDTTLTEAHSTHPAIDTPRLTKETIAAIQEAEAGKTVKFESVDKLMKDLDNDDEIPF